MPVSLYLETACGECGEAFDQPQRKDASAFCSERCRVRDFRRRHPAAPRAPRLLECGWCGSAFVQSGVGRTRVCCDDCGPRSTQLARHGRVRARERGLRADDFHAHEVFQRDEWTCGICLEPIDRTLEHPDVLSPTIDHVIPIERGGAHTLENCQAAHLRCNLRKARRTGALRR